LTHSGAWSYSGPCCSGFHAPLILVFHYPYITCISLLLLLLLEIVLIQYIPLASATHIMKDLSTAVPFLFVLAASVAGKTTQSSQGCGKPLPELVGPGVSKNLSIDSASGASPRQYRIHVPKTYDPNVPYPVILSFHGRTRDMLYQEQLTQLSEPSANFDGIVVYPNGVPVRASLEHTLPRPVPH